MFFVDSLSAELRSWRHRLSQIPTCVSRHVPSFLVVVCRFFFSCFFFVMFRAFFLLVFVICSCLLFPIARCFVMFHVLSCFLTLFFVVNVLPQREGSKHGAFENMSFFRKIPIFKWSNIRMFWASCFSNFTENEKSKNCQMTKTKNQENERNDNT